MNDSTHSIGTGNLVEFEDGTVSLEPTDVNGRKLKARYHYPDYRYIRNKRFEGGNFWFTLDLRKKREIEAYLNTNKRLGTWSPN